MSSWLDGHRMAKRMISASALFFFFACFVLAIAWAVIDIPEEAYEVPISTPERFAPLDINTFTISDPIAFNSGNSGQDLFEP